MLVLEWGTRLELHCLYDPLDAKQAYQLHFLDCSKVVVDAFPDADCSQEAANLLGITLGRADYAAPAIVSTDLFELHISYRRFHCITSR